MSIRDVAKYGSRVLNKKFQYVASICKNEQVQWWFSHLSDWQRRLNKTISTRVSLLITHTSVNEMLVVSEFTSVADDFIDMSRIFCVIFVIFMRITVANNYLCRVVVVGLCIRLIFWWLVVQLFPKLLCQMKMMEFRGGLFLGWWLVQLHPKVLCEMGCRRGVLLCRLLAHGPQFLFLNWRNFIVINVWGENRHDISEYKSIACRAALWKHSEIVDFFEARVHSDSSVSWNSMEAWNNDFFNGHCGPHGLWIMNYERQCDMVFFVIYERTRSEIIQFVIRKKLTL